MMSVGVREPIAAMNANALNLIAEGDSVWINDEVSTILARPAAFFEQFATDYAATFS